jgi:hypothetical protein
MTIGEITSTYRTMLRERQQTCSLNTRELYLLINTASNKIKQEILDKKHKLGFKNYKTIKLDLEEIIFKSECQPSFMGCKVLKSTYPLPPTLVNSNRFEMYIYNGQKAISQLNFIHGKRISKHPAIQNYYDVIDNYLYIFKNLELECITIQAAWEDVTNLQDLIGSNNQPCYNPLEDEFPLDEQYIPVLYMMLDKELNYYVKTKEDETTNERNKE